MSATIDQVREQNKESLHLAGQLYCTITSLVNEDADGYLCEIGRYKEYFPRFRYCGDTLQSPSSCCSGLTGKLIVALYDEIQQFRLELGDIAQVLIVVDQQEEWWILLDEWILHILRNTPDVDVKTTMFGGDRAEITFMTIVTIDNKWSIVIEHGEAELTGVNLPFTTEVHLIHHMLAVRKRLVDRLHEPERVTDLLFGANDTISKTKLNE